jgi:RNA polymerase sigma-70 factor (ECF subfamily)
LEGDVNPGVSGVSPDKHEARAEVQALARRLADGDRDAIGPAFDALWPIVSRYSARALAGSADAEDAAQLALTKFFGQVAGFDPERDALAWVLTIASYECRTLRKKALRRAEHAPVDAVSDQATPEELLIERDLEAAAVAALGALREQDARAILAGMADERDARARGVAFRKRLQRALERLRVAWRTKHGA